MKKDKIMYNLGYLILGVIVTLIVSILAIIFLIIGNNHVMRCLLILDGLFGGLTILMCFAFSWIIIDEKGMILRSIIKVIKVVTWDDVARIELKYKTVSNASIYVSTSCHRELFYVFFLKSKDEIDTNSPENKAKLPLRVVCSEKNRLLLNKYYKGEIPDWQGMYLSLPKSVSEGGDEPVSKCANDQTVLHPESFDYQNYFDNSTNIQDKNSSTDD